uniref:Regulatory protein zeste n=1 Tax=Timema bartmani TaxID=61472 RepID=A0A7R9I3J3_9NEOP|nr:unnamed protein product [Timema bartmani]
MAEKARNPPMSEEERTYLLEQIVKFPILENKKSDVGTIAAKKRAWMEITRIFNSNANFQKRTLLQLRKYWENVKAKRRKQLGEETRDLMSSEGGPYKPRHEPSCLEVKMGAPHLNYHLGYHWDGDAVAMKEAPAKHKKISIPEVTAAMTSAGSAITGTGGLENLHTGIATSSGASDPLLLSTPSLEVLGSLLNTSPNIQFLPTAPPPSFSEPPSPPSQPHSPAQPPSPLQPPHTTPDITRQGLIQRTACIRIHEAREKVWLQGDKELHCERLAEAKLNRQAAEKRLQQVEKSQQQSDELHYLEIARLRVKLKFETQQMELKLRHQEDMQRQALQAAKDQHQQESRIREVQLRRLLGLPDISIQDSNL